MWRPVVAHLREEDCYVIVFCLSFENLKLIAPNIEISLAKHHLKIQFVKPGVPSGAKVFHP